MALSRIKFCWKALLGALALSLLFPAASFAQDDEEAEGSGSKQPLEVNDSTSEVLNSLKAIDEAKDWDKALRIIDAALLKAKPGSYDEAVLYQVRAQNCYQKNDITGTMAAVDRCLQLDSQHHYFPKKTRREMLYLFAQLSFNEASGAKDLRQQEILYQKCDQTLQEWMQGAKEFTPDNLLFIAMLNFYRAQPGAGIAGVEQKMDKALMEKALEWTDRGLHSMARPRDNFYQLKLAELFQLSRFSDGAELLELLVKKKPESKNYWLQLFNTYAQLANEAVERHDDKAVLSANIRAIVTVERAQKLGFLNSQKDNYNLAVIYLTIGQFGEACQVLEQGLKDNTIERTRQNYELLANSFQQIHRDFKAINTLEDAAKLFPHSGQIEYQIAQIYFAINNTKNAFEHMKRCVDKGGTEEPHIAWLFYAYLALDLKEYDVALKAVEQAKKFPKGVGEATKMEEAIKATIADRDSRLQSQT